MPSTWVVVVMTPLGFGDEEEPIAVRTQHEELYIYERAAYRKVPRYPRAESVGKGRDLI